VRNSSAIHIDTHGKHAQSQDRIWPTSRPVYSQHHRFRPRVVGSQVRYLFFTSPPPFQIRLVHLCLDLYRSLLRISAQFLNSERHSFLSTSLLRRMSILPLPQICLYRLIFGLIYLHRSVNKKLPLEHFPPLPNTSL